MVLLPDEVLGFVMPSRFCLPDELGHEAWQRFGDLAPGWARVQAIVDYDAAVTWSSFRVPQSVDHSRRRVSRRSGRVS